MSVVLNNNIQLFQQQLEQHIETALEAAGLFVEGKAAINCHVDTGNLRGSITHEVDMNDKSVSIGTNVEYAITEEFRQGIKQGFGKHAFLKPAAEDNIAEIQAIIASYMRM